MEPREANYTSQTVWVVEDQEEDVPEDPEVLVLRLIYLIVTKYSWIVIVPIGLFGNVMAIIVTLQKDNRRISTCNYMTALALADSNTLLVLAWGMVLMSWRTDPPTEFAMQMNWYQGYASAVLSGFCLAEMTIDRLIVVRFPMAAPRLCTTRRACVTILVTFAVVFGLNLYIFFSYVYEFNEETGEGLLKMSVPHAPELETLGNTAQLAIGTILPFCIIVTCNIWIIVVLRNASKSREIMGVSKDGQKAREKETTHLTRMLILVSIAYVVTSIPFRLWEVSMSIHEVNKQYDMNEEYWKLRFYCQHFIILQFWELNYAINFYLYCIGGGKKYRDDIRNRLGKVFLCLSPKSFGERRQ
ncbi:mu-type opioid receptor-like [Lineus longissimus]|uniref:mu-type opioid receptor-like n=1 Tax=Lineus longissimus TaxID=88925 RepID=UPI00315CB7A0